MLNRQRYNSHQSCHKPRRWYCNRRGMSSTTFRRHIYWPMLKVRRGLPPNKRNTVLYCGDFRNKFNSILQQQQQRPQLLITRPNTPLIWTRYHRPRRQSSQLQIQAKFSTTNHLCSQADPPCHQPILRPPKFMDACVTRTMCCISPSNRSKSDAIHQRQRSIFMSAKMYLCRASTCNFCTIATPATSIWCVWARMGSLLMTSFNERVRNRWNYQKGLHLICPCFQRMPVSYTKMSFWFTCGPVPRFDSQAPIFG